MWPNPKHHDSARWRAVSAQKQKSRRQLHRRNFTNAVSLRHRIACANKALACPILRQTRRLAGFNENAALMLHRFCELLG